MRAILIDPQTQTLTEIELKTGDFCEICTAIGCRSFTTGAFLNGSLEAGFDSIDVSDDDMGGRPDPRFWFQVDADRDRPSSHPIAGRGLAIGTDKHGATCGLRIGLDELRARIAFTQRKFRGFKTYTGASARARAADVVAELKAPIVGGTEG
jgi:hypothetical protein